jgi:hypothetical protein
MLNSELIYFNLSSNFIFSLSKSSILVSFDKSNLSSIEFISNLTTNKSSISFYFLKLANSSLTNFNSSTID